jgi:hypothetical protein
MPRLVAKLRRAEITVDCLEAMAQSSPVDAVPIVDLDPRHPGESREF